MFSPIYDWSNLHDLSIFFLWEIYFFSQPFHAYMLQHGLEAYTILLGAPGFPFYTTWCPYVCFGFARWDKIVLCCSCPWNSTNILGTYQLSFFFFLFLINLSQIFTGLKTHGFTVWILCPQTHAWGSFVFLAALLQAQTTSRRNHTSTLQTLRSWLLPGTPSTILWRPAGSGT